MYFCRKKAGQINREKLSLRLTQNFLRAIGCSPLSDQKYLFQGTDTCISGHRHLLFGARCRNNEQGNWQNFQGKNPSPTCEMYSRTPMQCTFKTLILAYIPLYMLLLHFAGKLSYSPFRDVCENHDPNRRATADNASILST